MRTLTERLAKRIRRGQKWGPSVEPGRVILRWAEQYAMCRRWGQIPR